MQTEQKLEPNQIDPTVPSRRSHQAALGVAAVVGTTVALTLVQPAQAGPIDDLKLEADKLTGVTDSVVPVVVGVAILGGGMMLIKRVIFS